MMQNIDTKMNRNAIMENTKNAENVLKESIAMGIANAICLR